MGILLFFVFSGWGEAKGQNVYNTYEDFEDKLPPKILDNETFDGEYQMILTDDEDDVLHWLKNVFVQHGGTGIHDYSITYKIEVVSFPFMPNSDKTLNHTTPNGVRFLTTIKDEYYEDLLRKGGTSSEEVVTKDGIWVNNDWMEDYARHTIWRVFKSWEGWPFTIENELTFKGGVALSSIFFKDQIPPDIAPDYIYESSFNRIVLPHTVLKHHVYLNCGQEGETLEPIDSISFIIDLTRGKMKEYPFFTTNFQDTPSTTKFYDLAIVPTIQLGTSFDESTPPQNEVNYFPNSDMIGIEPPDCPPINISAENMSEFFHPYAGAEIDPSPNAPISYIHPAPFSKVGFYFHGDQKKVSAGYELDPNTGKLIPHTGIEHTYIIDENVDITRLNPNEKIIYNPSTVLIEANNLVFPSGYTFKTVRGLYPTQSEVNNSTACADKTGVDERLVHVPTDLPNETYTYIKDGAEETFTGKPSIYVLESGSKLTIEPCITLVDVSFLVKEGATLIYYPNQTYGDNYEMVDDGGTIQTIVQDTKCNDCRCLQGFDYEDDFEIPSGFTVTWNSDKIIKGSVTVKNGAILRIESATIQFADSEVTGHDFSGIIVEAGGKLELEYSALKVLDGTYCTDKHKFWDGIRLEGIYPQSIEQHAELNATGSLINSARNGVVVIPNTYNNFGTGDYWVSGGLASFNQCTFENNKIGYQVLGIDGYPNPKTDFKDCIFENNKALDTYVHHAILYSSQKTTFENCVFRTTSNLLEKKEVDERGIGILSYNSEIEVNFVQPEMGPYLNTESAFYNLYRAIENYHFGMGKSLQVRDTYFENNLQSITSNGSNLDRINDNVFKLNFGASGFEEDRPDENTPSLIYDAWGIYMFGANNYEIRNNSFDLGGFDRTDDDDQPNFYGIIGNHAYQSQGLIQGNIFDKQLENSHTDVIYTQTEEDNRFLQIKCNEYYKNDYSNGDRDLLVCPAIGNPDFDNRLENQGTGCGENSAANLFVNIVSNTCMEITENIEVGTLYKIDNGNTVPLLPFLYWPNGVLNTDGYPDCHNPMQQIEVQDCEDQEAPQNQVCIDGGGLPGKANSLVNDYNSVQIAAELKNGTYTLSEQVQLIGGVSRIYKEQDRISDAIDFLEAMDTDQSEILLFHLYLQNNLLNEAQSSLTELTIRNLYDVEWYNFYQLLLNVKNSSRGYGDLTSLEMQQIENTANSNSHAAISAQSLLGMLQQITYDRIPQKLPTASHKRQIVAEDKLEILIFPNPTKDKLNIQIPFEQTEAVIYDLTGKVVQKLVLEKGKNEIAYLLKAGSYFVRFKMDNQFITQKILILP